MLLDCYPVVNIIIHLMASSKLPTLLLAQTPDAITSAHSLAIPAKVFNHMHTLFKVADLRLLLWLVFQLILKAYFHQLVHFAELVVVL